jgi:hypothetical protein
MDYSSVDYSKFGLSQASSSPNVWDPTVFRPALNGGAFSRAVGVLKSVPDLAAEFNLFCAGSPRIHRAP